MSSEIINQTKPDIERLEPSHAAKGLTEISRQEIFSGPLPHPDLFKAYDEILPGSANRILTSFEN